MQYEPIYESNLLQTCCRHTAAELTGRDKTSLKIKIEDIFIITLTMLM